MDSELYNKMSRRRFAGSRAQDNLGLKNVRGEGLRQNPSEAVQWFRRAADQGYAAAQYNLGFSDQNGSGFVRDGRKRFVCSDLPPIKGTPVRRPISE